MSEQQPKQTVLGQATSTIGAGIGVICLALAIVILYRGCGDKGSLLPPVFPSDQKSQAR